MGQWSAQSRCVVVISNLLSSSLPTSDVIKPRIQFNLKNVSWVCHCFCCQSVTALIQLVIFPSKFCNNFSAWAHRFSDSQNLVPGWEVWLSHLLEIEKKSQDPSQTWRNSRSGTQQSVFWTSPPGDSDESWIWVDLFSAGQWFPM